MIMMPFALSLTSGNPDQVINRAKLQRAGKDNLFVRLLYGKDRPRIPRDMQEQEKFGGCPAKVMLSKCTTV
jgi:hypothetical protein